MSVPREGSRNTGEGIIVSIYPDVCLTPMGSTMVPVPYTIWAKQSDEASTTPTVRFTGQRTHNRGSLITKCQGDEAGTGGGVKSGTHNGLVEPMEHSSTVRSEGKNVIRHNDIWWMNNKNTQGKLMWVKAPDRAALTPQSGTGWQVADMSGAVPAPPAAAYVVPLPALAGAGAATGGTATVGTGTGAAAAGEAFGAALDRLIMSAARFAGPLAAAALVFTPTSTGGKRRADGTYEDELPRAMREAPRAVGRTDTNVNVSGEKKEKEEECRRTVIISESASPKAAQHIRDAQAAGYPQTLTLDRDGTDARRYGSTD
jgi:hypothetical protein